LVLYLIFFTWASEMRVPPQRDANAAAFARASPESLPVAGRSKSRSAEKNLLRSGEFL
jgi:hypothetical protein